MKQELRDQLCEYLGELLYQQENTFEWIEKDKVTRKINAVYTLLDIDKKDNTFNDFVKGMIKDLKFK